MQNIASMTAADVISDTVLDEVFSEEDEIQKAPDFGGQGS